MEQVHLCDVEGVVGELVELAADDSDGVREFGGVIGCIEGCFNLGCVGKQGDVWTKWTNFHATMSQWQIFKHGWGWRLGLLKLTISIDI